jgi:hypothetical protein
MRSLHHPGLVPGASPAWLGSRPRRWVWSRSFLLVLVLVSTSLCRAEELAEPASTANPQILLLRNGSILRGKILARGEDYLIQAPHGQVVVPGTLVRAACRDLQEAYEFMQERAAAQSEGSAYVTLAKWCQSVQMFDEARASLELALNLDANLDEARHLLILNAELQSEHRQSQRPREAAAETPPPSRDPDAHLGGLPKSLAKQFATRIQPILANNCSSASCHGPRSETGFRLERVPVGQRSERGAVERNLGAVSDYLDFRQPSQSPLLQRGKQAHGKPVRPLWTGPTGKQQLAELQTWVREAAPHLHGAPPDPPTLVQAPRSGSSTAVDSPKDPELVLAAAEQVHHDEAGENEESSSADTSPAGVSEMPRPARLPPQGGKTNTAKGGAGSRQAHQRTASRSDGETPPARLKPRAGEFLHGPQKSPVKTAAAADKPSATAGRDLFDPEEFNRNRKPRAE